MPDKNRRYPVNVPGRYYVDDSCIDCDLCRVTAPDNFAADEDAGHSYVYKQPETPEEEELCRQAKEECPVEAIGDDGGEEGEGGDAARASPGDERAEAASQAGS